MLILIQIIKRMQYLEYSNLEINETLRSIVSGENSAEDLFNALDIEMTPRQIERFEKGLLHLESACAITLNEEIV